VIIVYSLGRRILIFLETFKNLGITHLNLGDNNLESKSTEELRLIFNALSTTIAVGLLLLEVKTMSLAQCQAIQVNPNVRLLDEDKQPINLANREIINLCRRLGFKIPPSPFVNLLSFFIAQEILPQALHDAHLPEELTDKINQHRSSLN
jgi:hypothetical protein